MAIIKINDQHVGTIAQFLVSHGISFAVETDVAPLAFNQAEEPLVPNVGPEGPDFFKPKSCDYSSYFEELVTQFCAKNQIVGDCEEE